MSLIRDPFSYVVVMIYRKLINGRQVRLEIAAFQKYPTQTSIPLRELDYPIKKDGSVQADQELDSTDKSLDFGDRISDYLGVARDPLPAPPTPWIHFAASTGCSLHGHCNCLEYTLLPLTAEA